MNLARVGAILGYLLRATFSMKILTKSAGGKIQKIAWLSQKSCPELVTQVLHPRFAAS